MVPATTSGIHAHERAVGGALSPNTSHGTIECVGGLAPGHPRARCPNMRAHRLLSSVRVLVADRVQHGTVLGQRKMRMCKAHTR
jgi:hypothetical protein